MSGGVNIVSGDVGRKEAATRGSVPIGPPLTAKGVSASDEFDLVVSLFIVLTKHFRLTTLCKHYKKCSMHQRTKLHHLSNPIG